MISKKTLIQTAFWLMVATFGSRILGFLREVQLAYYFGLSPMRGAFTVAFKIPNLIRTLVADAAISAAFIPVFKELLMKEKTQEAYKVGSQMINIALLVLSALVILCELCMPLIIRITTPGFTSDPELFNHTVQLSRIIFPIIILLGAGGVLVGILHAMNHFSAPAIAPIFWNIVNISFVFFLYHRWGIYSAAWGLLAATLLQLIIQFLPFLKLRWQYYFKLGLSHPAMREVGILIIPVTLSIGIINFNALIDNFFASLLGPTEVAAIDSAFRLFQLPQGMFAIAIGTVLFPTLSGLIVKEDFVLFSKTLSTGIRQIFFITLPFTGWFMALSMPISRLCFERGNFTSQDTQMVSWALIFYSLGMAFTSANTLLNRGFYSLKKTWLPLYVGLINMILNALLDWILMKPLGHGGICLSTSLVSTFNFFALAYLMKKEIPEFKIRSILTPLFQIIFLTGMLGVTSYLVWHWLDIQLGTSLFSQMLSLGGSFIVSGLLYLALHYCFKSEELKQTLEGIFP
ncbi:MAG: murein biosynthesis integral membrane protein MurJ [Deltaproteobacteria bacterium GWA2_38_16]|nr:MAG: murein biosynthesis integral membrane protein MurJ [Deltaproteobacteria bacterium GWA2_38_16]OGQ02163.1 MAG: murein biosynthesis integral membrane protein MurJ [Deltaproteobacteria bacterium RIFCSPHIGHO2_02_FULL_38_15]OGQ34490.1 MAG: murein biosynthesis integral membrane protein MurJ [Deltaproteobacteria bacterium RIFCSPLOWO2_01_FULL_38_9]HBQ21956.1 murein biosynthesis integral membrane protein MurJ [Deltaproteobacteria bacterium]